MRSARSGDKRSLDIQLEEAMSIEELTLSVKQLKKNMSYVMEFLKSQLELIPAESTEEKKQVTDKRAFIAGKIKTLSIVVKDLLKEPSDEVDSINSDQFITILDKYKDTFTDILVDGRFLDAKDERLVSSATLTIIRNDDYKASLAAIDQLVESHFTNALTNSFKRMVQEKNFSALVSVKDFTKRHYDIDDQEAAKKLKAVFDELFSAKEDEELRKAFFAAVADPTKEENITALKESYEYEAQKEDLAISEFEDEEDNENELDDTEVKFTQENAENFIALTQMYREIDKQDDGVSEIENKDNQQEVVKKQESDDKTFQENERLKSRVVELEYKLAAAEKTLLEKKEPVSVISLSSTPVPVPASVLPPTVSPEDLRNRQDLAYCIGKIILPTLMMQSGHSDDDRIIAAERTAIKEIDKIYQDLYAGTVDSKDLGSVNNYVRMFLKDYCLSSINDMPKNKANLSLIQRISTHYNTLSSEEKSTPEKLRAIVNDMQEVVSITRNSSKAKNDSYFTDKDFSIIFAALQAEGMSNNGWKIDNKKLKEIKTKDSAEFTIPLMLEKSGRRLLWSNNQPVALKFLKESNGKIVVINSPQKGDGVSSLIQRIQDSIANPEKTRTFIDENNNPERKKKMG